MQLERYLDVFDRQQINVVLLEDLRDSPERVIKGIYEFLDVDPEYIPPRLGERKHQTENRVGQTRAFMTAIRKWPAYNSVSNLVPEKTKGVLNRFLRKKIDPPQKMTAADREFLIDCLKDDILSLQAYLKRDLSAWLE